MWQNLALKGTILPVFANNKLNDHRMSPATKIGFSISVPFCISISMFGSSWNENESKFLSYLMCCGKIVTWKELIINSRVRLNGGGTVEANDVWTLNIAYYWNTNSHSYSILIKEYTQMRTDNGKRVKIHAFGCKPLHSCIFPTARPYFTKLK